MAIKTTPYDTANYLTDDDTIFLYLTHALKSNDPRIFAKALGTVARAKGGISQLARKTGIARPALHRALSDTGNPEFGTVLKVMQALGLQLTASKVSKGKAA
jgi:probable addiction module antidote protein